MALPLIPIAITAGVSYIANDLLDLQKNKSNKNAKIGSNKSTKIGYNVSTLAVVGGLSLGAFYIYKKIKK